METDVTEHFPQRIPAAQDLGPRIRAARLERGMTLAAVGGGEISPSLLSYIEQGKRKPSLRTLEIIARRLNLPVSYLLDERAQSDDSVDLLLEIAEADVDRHEPQACLRRLDALGPLPEELLPRGLRLRGSALRQLGRSHLALGCFRDALEVAERLGQEAAIPRLLHSIGCSLYDLRAYEEALRFAHRAATQVSRSEHDPMLQGRILVLMGHLELVMNRADKAAEHYRGALDIFESVRDLHTMASLYSGLSQLYADKADLGQALRYARLSAVAFEASNDSRWLTHELGNLAWRFWKMGESEEAISTALKAIERAQKFAVPEAEANAHATLATIYVEAGDLETAEREAGRAIKTSGGQGAGYTDGLQQLGNIAELRGEPGRADELYGQAIKSLEELNDLRRYADACQAYSRLLERRGDLSRALHFSRLAAEGRTSEG